MHHVYDRETGNELTVTDQWLARNRRLVTLTPPKSAEPEAAKPSAPSKRATGAEVTAPAVDDTSALPDTNE